MKLTLIVAAACVPATALIVRDLGVPGAQTLAVWLVLTGITRGLVRFAELEMR